MDELNIYDWCYQGDETQHRLALSHPIKFGEKTLAINGYVAIIVSKNIWLAGEFQKIHAAKHHRIVDSVRGMGEVKFNGFLPIEPITYERIFHECNCEQCPGCDGLTEHQSMEFNASVFNRKYLSMVSNLPNAALSKVSTPGIACAKFTFDDGFGFIAPLNSNYEHHTIYEEIQ